MPEIRLCTLVSGSSGNAVYAECADGAILVDAGVSGRAIERAMQTVGGHIDRVDGLVLTHDHHDHARGAGVLSRRHGLPLFMTEGTHRRCAHDLHRVVGPRRFRPGDILCVGGFHIHTLATPHDAQEPVALVLERNGLRVGVLTDLGTCWPGLADLLPTLDAVVLESNYDPQMLATGPYPKKLKARIASARGHISNEEAAALVRDFADTRLQAVMLAHLSETNNRPEIALGCMQLHARELIARQELRILVAPRHVPSPVLRIRAREGASG